MDATHPLRRYWLVLGSAVFLIPASHLLRFFVQRSDIWWTPKGLSVPLVDTSDRVEIYVRDGLLQEQVNAQRLQLVTEQGPVTLAASDVRLRFNNRDRVRAEQIPSLLSAAVGAAASGLFVFLGFLGWWPATQTPRQHE